LVCMATINPWHPTLGIKFPIPLSANEPVLCGSWYPPGPHLGSLWSGLLMVLFLGVLIY
jgi:hypothetical protein